MAVSREVTRHDRIGDRPHCVSDLGPEGAVAVAQEHRHRAVAQRHRTTAAAVPPSGRRAAIGVGDGEVEMAVAREVTRHNRVGGRPHGVSDLGPECAVAVAQQHRHRAVAQRFPTTAAVPRPAAVPPARRRATIGVGDGEVEMAVAGEVTRDNRIGGRPHGIS